MTKKKPSNIPEVDIVLWGGTPGLLAGCWPSYLWPKYGASGKIRFALGGLDKSELESVHRDLKADGQTAAHCRQRV